LPRFRSVQSNTPMARMPTCITWSRSAPIRSPTRNWNAIWPFGSRDATSAPS